MLEPRRWHSNYLPKGASSEAGDVLIHVAPVRSKLIRAPASARTQPLLWRVREEEPLADARG